MDERPNRRRERISSCGRSGVLDSSKTGLDGLPDTWTLATNPLTDRSASTAIRAESIGPSNVILPLSKTKGRPARSRLPRTIVASPLRFTLDAVPVAVMSSAHSLSRPRPVTKTRRAASTSRLSFSDCLSLLVSDADTSSSVQRTSIALGPEDGRLSSETRASSTTSLPSARRPSSSSVSVTFPLSRAMSPSRS